MSLGRKLKLVSACSSMSMFSKMRKFAGYQMGGGIRTNEQRFLCLETEGINFLGNEAVKLELGDLSF